MQKTSIEWCDWSANPLKLELPDGTRINACVHKSRGCEACYAETITRRWWKKEWGKFPGYTPALLKLGIPVLVEEELKAVLRLSRRIAEGKADPKENKIFWNDMTDEYLDFWPDEFIDKLFAVRALTPNLIHQVLTKRAERMYLELFTDTLRGATANGYLPNLWLGVSVEDQKTADERIPWLLKTPAAVRWVSYEPALGPVDFTSLGEDGTATAGLNALTGEQPCCHEHPEKTDWHNALDWTVVGGESGPGARPFDVQWARATIVQCKAASVPVFVKQLGARPFEGELRKSKGLGVLRDAPEPVYYLEFGHWLKLTDKKGGSMEEWPADIRVREFPKG